jgi:hypothetical protein
VAQTALTGVTGQENSSFLLSEPVGTLAYIPSNSLLTAAGTNLNQFWQQVKTGLEPDSPLQQVIYRTIESVQTPWGLDLSEDIFSWVTGNYSLALITSPNNDNTDWVFVTENSDETEVKEAIKHLDELAQKQGYGVDQLTVADQSVTAWTKLKTSANDNITRLEAQVKGAHLEIDNYTILTTSLEAMSQVLSTNENSLVTSEKFQQAISALPVENNGYFYLNFSQGISAIKKSNGILGQNLKTETEENLNSIIGIAATSTMPDSETTQLDLMVALKAK